MDPQNRAAWLMKKQDPILVVQDAPYHKPEAMDVVIRTKAIALNPADVLLQKLGIMIDTYPAILGCDVAGIVEEVGSDITHVRKGDRVVGTARPLPSGVYKYAGFQLYPVLKMPEIVRVPDDVAFTDAVVLPLGIKASSACLFHHTTLGLEIPPSEGGKGKTLLVWGASSSIGSCGVQLAIAAGYEVFGIASAKNHDMVKSLGASEVFDHNSLDIVADIVTALRRKTIVGAYDAISKPETLHALCGILRDSGGKKLVAAIAPGAENLAIHDVTIKTNFGATDYASSIGPRVWQDFLGPALQAGNFQYMPRAEVVGHGLEDIQAGIDLLAKGVSAKKLVISLEE